MRRRIARSGSDKVNAYTSGFPDPAKATGSEDEVLAVFRAVRDDIARKVPELLQRQGKDR